MRGKAIGVRGNGEMILPNAVVWKTTKLLRVGSHIIPCAENLPDQEGQTSGVLKESPLKSAAKDRLWPLIKLHGDLFISGFIEWQIGKWIREFVNHNTTFLDVGCGTMRLRKYVQDVTTYNAFDLTFSESDLTRVLRNGTDLNVAVASATDIPLESDSVSLVASTEVFEHVPDLYRALDEIHRVCVPKAKLLCSVPNINCYKYSKKGPPIGAGHIWDFEGFKKLVMSHNYGFVRGQMRGVWIPFPLWLTKTSYQVPVVGKSEFLNTTFFYVFQVEK